jgi:hypothetical protein
MEEHIQAVLFFHVEKNLKQICCYLNMKMLRVSQLPSNLFHESSNKNRHIDVSAHLDTLW